MALFFPEIGLFFWTVFAFGIFLWIMRKFAWKPLLAMIKNRETAKEESLALAETARAEFAELEIKQKQMFEEAQVERQKLLQETRADRQKILDEAKAEAEARASKIIETTRAELLLERDTAFKELKAELLHYSVQIAEIILKQKMEIDNTHQKLVDRYLTEMKVN